MLAQLTAIDRCGNNNVPRDRLSISLSLFQSLSICLCVCLCLSVCLVNGAMIEIRLLVIITCKK